MEEGKFMCCLGSKPVLMTSEVLLEASNQQIPPATSQVIAAYYFDKLHRFS